MRSAERLAPRQRQYLVGRLEGKSDSEIAREHGVTVNTVREALRHAATKLGIDRQRDLVAEAVRRGWLEVHEERMQSP